MKITQKRLLTMKRKRHLAKIPRHNIKIKIESKILAMAEKTWRAHARNSQPGSRCHRGHRFFSDIDRNKLYNSGLNSTQAGKHI